MTLVIPSDMTSWLVVFLMFQSVWGFKWPWEDSDEGSDDDRNPYEPYAAKCPSHEIWRKADNVSDWEQAYIRGRIEKTNKELVDFLDKRAQIPNFDGEEFINKYAHVHNISIGLAYSGGGYRAMLNGAGQLLGLDNRYNESNKRALGGLLQSSSYITGLSGGSWLVGTLVLNNWISVDDILSGRKPIWELSDSIFNPNGINVVKTGQYYYNIQQGIKAKADAGFLTSITDIWGRMLSYQFMENNGGENVTWSSIRNLEAFQNFDMPFPIVLANGRNPNTQIVNLNSTVYEFSPFELGSWDPSVDSFIDVKYTGTYLDNGKPNNSDSCAVNFDNAGFVMGTSSSLFNSFVTRLDEFDVNSLIKRIINSTLTGMSHDEVDIALYEPNPFYNIDEQNTEPIITDNRTLYLVDGSTDEQGVPFYPLIQSKRHVDIIFGFDNSGDSPEDWPNGSSIIHTYRRQFTKQGKGSPIPFVPETFEDFVEQKLNTRPVFFGCNASSFDSLLDFHENDEINGTDVPLIVYLPNHELSAKVNTSTFKLSYTTEERNSLIQNGFEVSSRNNLSDDRQWPTCVGCAIIRRQQERFKIEQSDECKRCFQQYCWEPPQNEIDGKFSTISGTESATSMSKSHDSSQTSQTGTADSGATTMETSSSKATSSAASSSKSSKDQVSAISVSWYILLLSTVVGHLMI